MRVSYVVCDLCSKKIEIEDHYKLEVTNTVREHDCYAADLCPECWAHLRELLTNRRGE
ncbi:hypothetical protein [Desulfothermobacter acidiphilus]|uniref:hypothetical protein n=1 Tax=Desulfothermobacter acidiphilus TaxID=1938353 RepID=UPI003F88EE51